MTTDQLNETEHVKLLKAANLFRRGNDTVVFVLDKERFSRLWSQMDARDRIMPDYLNKSGCLGLVLDDLAGKVIAVLDVTL